MHTRHECQRHRLVQLLREAKQKPLAPADNAPSPRVGRLLAAWVAATGGILVTFSAKLKDLTRRPSPQPILAPAVPPLPPLDPAQFMAALEDQVQGVLRQAAAVLNEDPNGGCPKLAAQRVRALFQELEQEALKQAFELRFAAAESSRAVQGSTGGVWARRYRRMHAKGKSGLGRPVGRVA